MKKFLIAGMAVAAFAGSPALAGDMAVKAPPAAAAPVANWAGFYAGFTFGWAWEDPTVTATGNDPLSIASLAGTIPGLPGGQPMGPVSFRGNGAFGGVEAGWNWQAGRYVAGLEADFNASGIQGQGATTTVLTTNGVVTILQQLSAKQDVRWFGTVRPRLGWLATDNLLLYGTGGLAYGRIHDTVNYGTATSNGGSFGPNLGGFSFSCPNAGPTSFSRCILGESARNAFGWTAGAGAEYRVPGSNASFKVEYLFVDLGSSNATAIALGTALAGTKPTSLSAAFSQTQFSIVRVGLNWKL